MSEPLWRPTAHRIERANLTRFIETIRRQRSDVTDFSTLYQWSIDYPEQFWVASWEFCDVRCSRTWDAVFEPSGHPVPLSGAWFRGARLNFAENLLRYRDDQPALVFRNERNDRRSLSYAQLFEQVARTATALRQCGVQAGDRVAGFMPNIPETVIAMLASASLGAVWSSTSPDFGLQGVLDRFGQIEPKVLFAADGYWYNGRRFDVRSRVAQIAQRIPSIEKVVVAEYLQLGNSLIEIPNAVRMADFGDQTSELSYLQLPFDHPLYILYSSGTTGVPKCIVHSAGGTLLQHLKELVLHTDLQRDDCILYYTTCGWMMWNWLVSSLAVGATVLLYDGSPQQPSAAQLWDIAEQEKITVLGTSARYLAAIEKAGVKPARSHDLASLRTILSTGSPLSAESFDFVYEHIKSDVCLSSISGGTDIVSCFALGNPIGPVFRGELQSRGLGMDVRVFDEAGQPQRGRPGELVCCASFPSMPIYFWNDPGGQKYREAYFDHDWGVWRHGDWVELTAQDGMIFHGRSDAVLNPGGVRIGTAEIYRQVEQIDEVLESVVVAQDFHSDTRVVLFVKLRPDRVLDDELRERIKKQIRDNTTPRHVPAKVIQVAAIPRTLSGKIVELAVRDVIHGRTVKNQDALANPESLALFENLPELSPSS